MEPLFCRDQLQHREYYVLISGKQLGIKTNINVSELLIAYYLSHQVFQRNPLCGINYPCGDYANSSNTCENLTDMTDFVEDEKNRTLPRGFRICNQPNTALWSTILCLGTFFIAVLLRKFRQGKFLGKKVS